MERPPEDIHSVSGAQFSAGHDEDRPVPRQAWIVSLYHVFILIAGLLITTYFIGPDRLVSCAAEGIVATPPASPAAVNPAECHTNALLVLLFALCFGMIGSTLNASRYVVLAVRRRRYDCHRILWQILTPLHGGVLAIVAVYVVVGGLFSLVQGTNVDREYGYFIGGFSFLVGFSSELFVKRLIAATEALFGEAGNSKSSESVETLGAPDAAPDENPS